MLGLPAPWQRELAHALAVLILLALRIGPCIWLLLGVTRVGSLRVLVSAGASVALWPLALASAPADLVLGLPLWAAAPWELARGLVFGVALVLPLWALGWAGRLSETLRDLRAAWDASEIPLPLEVLYASGALALLFASGLHLTLFRGLVGSLLDLPLGIGVNASAGAQLVFLELARLIGRAFALSVLFAAPVLLVVLGLALTLGLGSRISGALSAAWLSGPLLPWVGLSAACLSVSSILGELPPALRVFLEKALALLSGLR